MHNSATINLNCLHFGMKAGVRKFFNSSSACMYGIEILGDGEQTWRNSDTRLIRGQLN